MRKNDAFFIAIKFNHHKLRCFVCLYLFAVFLVQVAVRCKSFQSVRQLHDGALVVFANNGSFVDSAHGKSILQCVPGIFFQLLVTQLQLAVGLVDTKDLDFDLFAHLRVFAWVVETFQPAQVADVDHAADAGSQFHKHTVRSNILHQAGMAAAFRELSVDGIPGIFAQLFDGKAHLAGVFIQCNDFRFVDITQLEEFLCIDGGIGPGNFTYVYQSFHTRLNFEECAVVFDVDYFAFYYFAFFHTFRQDIPRMRSQLFQTEADTFFLVVEIKHDNFQLLIQFQHLARVRDTSP